MKIYVVYHEGGYEEPRIYTEAKDALDELEGAYDLKVVKYNLDVPKCRCEGDKPK
jgi:hypothetical protein